MGFIEVIITVGQKVNKIVATIEARMTSSRLPGKVLMPAMGKPMLEHLIERLRSVSAIDEIVIATTINNADQAIVDFAETLDISVYRGSEEDVMARVIGAAESVNADIIVEITGDCPILDPDIVEQMIRMYHCHDASYVSNVHIRSYPDGMDVQVFSLETLKRSSAITTDKLDREHVTLHIRNNPEIFSHVHLVAPTSLHQPELGLTLDESEDYKLLSKIIEKLGPIDPLFSCMDVLELLSSNPDWIKINQHVLRKGDT